MATAVKDTNSAINSSFPLFKKNRQLTAKATWTLESQNLTS